MANPAISRLFKGPKIWQMLFSKHKLHSKTLSKIRIGAVNSASSDLNQASDLLRRLDRAGNEASQANRDLNQAQGNLAYANNQNNNSQSYVTNAANALNTVISTEPIVYGQGAGGMLLTDSISISGQEITAPRSGPDSNNLGLATYAAGLSIVWGSGNANYGNEVIIAQSATARQTIAIGQSLANYVSSTDEVAGETLIMTLYGALEENGSPINCLKNLSCEIASNQGYWVLILPKAIFVVDPNSNYKLRTIALLNTSLISNSGDRRAIINLVSNL